MELNIALDTNLRCVEAAI